jgi:colanic acid biosynthesis glycosyl transferase WcaI
MSKLRLLVIINNFPPDRGGGAAVIGDLCYSLAQKGFEVTVRCAYPYYPEWADKSGRNGLRIWCYPDQGVRVERYGLFIPGNPNSLWQRLLHELSFLLSLLRSLPRGRDFDVVMAYCPAVSSLVFGVINKLIWRKPLWLNVQDLAAEAATASGLVRRRWLGELLRKTQAWFFNRADVWSTIAPVMAARLAPARRRGQPLLLMPNWLNESLRQEIDLTLQSAPERSLHQPIRLLYAGNIGKKQNLLALLKMLQATALSFEFRVHGSGAQASDVEGWIRETCDNRFQFGPFLEERGFAQVLLWTDFFVISETEDSGASFMPSKLIPGIYSGAPILALCDESGPLGSEVRSHDIGPWFSWESVHDLPDFLQTLHAQLPLYMTWVTNARVRACSYDRPAIIDRCANALTELAAGRMLESDSF